MAAPNYGETRLLAIDTQTATTSATIPFNAAGYTYVTAYVTGVGTTSSGVITFEEADYDLAKQPMYSGTWSSISTTNASDVTGGATKAVHFTTAAYSYIRARISTTIGGGGTISVTFVAR